MGAVSPSQAEEFELPELANDPHDRTSVELDKADDGYDEDDLERAGLLDRRQDGGGSADGQLKLPTDDSELSAGLLGRDEDEILGKGTKVEQLIARVSPQLGNGQEKLRSRLCRQPTIRRYRPSLYVCFCSGVLSAHWEPRPRRCSTSSRTPLVSRHTLSFSPRIL